MQEFSLIIPVPAEQVNWDWISHQYIQDNVAYRYDNGIGVTHDYGCWALYLQPDSKSWGVTDCPNAKAINKQH